MSTSSRASGSWLHRRTVRVLATVAVVAAPLAALPLLATSASARPAAAACSTTNSFYPKVVSFDGPEATATVSLNAKAPTCVTLSLILYRTPGLTASGNAKYPQEAVTSKTIDLQPGQTETIALVKGEVCYSQLDLVFGSHIETPLTDAYYSKNHLLIDYDDFPPAVNCTTPTSTPPTTPTTTISTSVLPTSATKPPLSTSVLPFSTSKAPKSSHAVVAGTLPFTGPTAPVRSGLLTGLGLIAAGGALVMVAGRRRRNIGTHH
jgi:hypothetical protein